MGGLSDIMGGKILYKICNTEHTRYKDVKGDGFLLN